MKPVDIVVLLRLSMERDGRPRYADLGVELCLSSSEIHASVKRSQESQLLHGNKKDLRLNRTGLLEFLLHGLRYAFPAKRGPLGRGVVTGYAAPPLDQYISGTNEPPPVWPYAFGSSRGYALEPLHKKVPEAALKSPALYELLALVDAIREGRARERNLAAKELERRLLPEEHAQS